MALRPEERYASPRALAGDLEHWLADEPVAVYREPLTTRLTRWGRRHRTAAASIGALLVTAVAALAISTVLIGFEQFRTQEQFNRAERYLSVVNERGVSLRRENYVHRISRALREIQDDGNIALAESLLDGCPADLRGWEWNYVKRQAHLDVLTYQGHLRRPSGAANRLDSSPSGSVDINPPTSVKCLAVSPDGKWAASGTGRAYDYARKADRAEIRIWDIATGLEQPPIQGLIGTVQAVAFSPDGKLLAAAGGTYEPVVGGWVMLWDMEPRKPRSLLIRDASGMTGMSVAFSPDSRFLAIGYGRYQAGPTGQLTLHDLTTNKPWTPLRPPDHGISDLAFCPDPNRPLLAASRGDGVELWDWKTRTRVGPTRSVPDEMSGLRSTAVAISRDGRLIASAGDYDGAVRLWDSATGKKIRSLDGHKGKVQDVAFSLDGTRLASVCEDRSVRLWDVSTGRELATFRGHSFHVFAVAFRADGRQILSGGFGGLIKVWDVQRSKPVIFRSQPGWVTGVAFSHDGCVVTESDEWRGMVLEGRSDEELKALRKTITVDKRLWDPDTGDELPCPAGNVVDPDLGAFRRLADLRVASPDGRLIAQVDKDHAPNDVRIIDAASGRIVHMLVGHTRSVFCIAFSPDGRRIATASDDRTVKLWDAETGLEVLSLGGHVASCLCVVFSPDGHRLVSGSIDHTARVWDARPVEEPGGGTTDSSAQ
jgi:WD40 repeat protein